MSTYIVFNRLKLMLNSIIQVEAQKLIDIVEIKLFELCYNFTQEFYFEK